MIRILSLGAGVQSSTLLLMSEHGELDRLDAAVFADTGWEPRAVYDWLGWLERHCTTRIERVSVGNIRTDTLAGRLPRNSATSEGRGFATMPLYATDGHGAQMLRRQCTNEYKLRPLRARIRALLAESGKTQADLWIGISRNEAHRMRDSDVRYIANRYPLIDAGMSRWDCLRWLHGHGYPTPPKSACVGCPFKDARRWRETRDTMPDEWRQAVEFDAAIRTLPRIRGEVYLHRSLRPLDEVDLSTEEDHGQGNLFGNECLGLCGT